MRGVSSDIYPFTNPDPQVYNASFYLTYLFTMLSAIVIAKNEEARIGRCLASLAFADEIIVLDSGSSDNTVAIARTFTDKVYETDWQGYGVQKQRALALAAGNWVLNLDADEYVTEILQKEIVQAIHSNKAEAWQIPIQMHFYGKAMQYSCSPGRHVRLFRREGARFSNDLVHEKILLPENTRKSKINAAILHDSFQDLSHALYKMNKYSSYSAHIRIDNNKQTSFIRTLAGSAWMFFRCYLLQRGFLDGKAGLILACLNAQGTFYRGMKCLYPDIKTGKSYG